MCQNYVAFKNPDGTIILEIQNTSSSTVSPLIRVGTKEFTPALEGSSVNTFNIGGTEPAGDWIPATTYTAVKDMPQKQRVVAKSGSLGIYDMRGRLIKMVNNHSTQKQSLDGTNTNGRKLTSGLYFTVNRVENKTYIKKEISR